MKILLVRDQQRLRSFLASGVIMLDPALPDEAGSDLLQEWQRGGFDEPVLILGAGDAGPGGHLQPAGLSELVAGIRSLLRQQASGPGAILERGRVRMDLTSRTVTCDDQPVELTRREFALLEMLLRNAGRVMSREQICSQVWETNSRLNPNLLDVYMCKLRAKLEGDPAKPFLKTIRGMGYQLV